MEDKNLFSVKNLITEKFKLLIENTKDFSEKLNILLRLLDYETEYPENAEEIAEIYYKRTDERYENGTFYISDDDREFLLEFAEKVRKFDEVVLLLDKICNSGNDLYDHDTVIDEAIKKMSIIKDINSIEILEEKNEKTDNKLAMPNKHFATMNFRAKIEQAKKKKN